jgi:uncharacterized protein (UPF0305 family)
MQEIKKFKNSIEYYNDGELHRDDDLPAIEHADGTKVWFQHGEIHRDNGPAFQLSNGIKVWYKNGQRHRLDGPAHEGINKSLWYIEGKQYTEEEFNKIISGKKESNNMYTKDIKNKIQYLKEEYEYLNKRGSRFVVNYNIEFSETINFYYKKPFGKINKLSLQEELDKELSVDDSNFYEQKQSQYEEQVKYHRKMFQERINIFEDNCKELAKELGKDFDSFLTEDVVNY